MADREEILKMWIDRHRTNRLTQNQRNEILKLPEMDALEKMRSDEVRRAISGNVKWDAILRKAQSIEKTRKDRIERKRRNRGVDRPPVKPDPQGEFQSPNRDSGGRSDDDPVFIRTRPSER